MKVVGENRRKVAAAEAASSQHMGVQSGKEETKKKNKSCTCSSSELG